MTEVRTVTVATEEPGHARATQCNMDFCRSEAPNFVRVGDLCLWLCDEHFELLETKKHGVKQ